jgi:hypothetical protein
MKRINGHQKSIEQSIKSIIFSMLVCGFLICATPQTSFAYDNDTHFWLTYYLALKVGYTHTQATQIASANISVDFDPDTTPVLPRPQIGDLNRLNSHFSFVRLSYHALASKTDVNKLTKPEVIHWWDPMVETDENIKKAAAGLVANRKNEFWSETLSTKKNPGFFLHYLQDMFSHRDFKSFVGHAGYNRVDFLSSDRSKAHDMTAETLKYLYVFRETVLKKNAGVKNPDELRIEDFLSPNEVEEIKQTVEKLCDVNDSKGIEPNRLVTEWSNLSPGTKMKKYNLPPNEFLRVLVNLYFNAPAPDSSKARDVIINLTRKDGHEAPYMWLYEYNKYGIVTQKTAKKARRYKAEIRPVFNAVDEMKNMEVVQVFDESVRPKRRHCLPYTLVGDTQVKIPYCN